MPLIALLLAAGAYYLVLNMNKDYETLQLGGSVVIGVLATYALASIFNFPIVITILVFLGITFAAPVTMSKIRYSVGRNVFFRSRGRAFGLTAAQAEEKYYKDAKEANARGKPFESVDYEAWFYKRKYH